MATTLQNALEIVTQRMGLSANTTYASNVDINMAIESQINATDLLNKICDYADHAYYISGTTAVFFDKLPQSVIPQATGGYPSTYSFTEHDVAANSLKSQRDTIYHTVTAKYKELQAVIIPASGNLPQLTTYSLEDKEQSVSTGQNSGTTYTFTALTYNQDNDVADVLARKKALFNLKKISVKIVGLQPIAIGSHIQVDVGTATADFRALNVTYNIKENSVSLSGYGSYTNV